MWDPGQGNSEGGGLSIRGGNGSVQGLHCAKAIVNSSHPECKAGRGEKCVSLPWTAGMKGRNYLGGGVHPRGVQGKMENRAGPPVGSLSLLDKGKNHRGDGRWGFLREIQGKVTTRAISMVRSSVAKGKTRGEGEGSDCLQAHAGGQVAQGER